MKLKCKNYFPWSENWIATSHADVVKHADETLHLALKVRRAWKTYYRFITDDDAKRAHYVKWNIIGAVRRLNEAIRDFNIIAYSPHWDSDTNLVALGAAVSLTQFISLPIGCYSTDL